MSVKKERAMKGTVGAGEGGVINKDGRKTEREKKKRESIKEKSNKTKQNQKNWLTATHCRRCETYRRPVSTSGAYLAKSSGCWKSALLNTG